MEGSPIETVTDLDNWRDRVERNKLRIDAITMLSERARAFEPSTAKPRRRWASCYEIVLGLILDFGDEFDISSGALLKLAMAKLKIKAANLTDLSLSDLGRLYDSIGYLRMSEITKLREQSKAAQPARSQEASIGSVYMRTKADLMHLIRRAEKDVQLQAASL